MGDACLDLFLQILILVHFHSPSESHRLLLPGVFFLRCCLIWGRSGGCSIFFVFIQAELLTWCIQMHIADEEYKLYSQLCSLRWAIFLPAAHYFYCCILNRKEHQHTVIVSTTLTGCLLCVRQIPYFFSHRILKG